jgi:hypothetical protein
MMSAPCHSTEATPSTHLSSRYPMSCAQDTFESYEFTKFTRAHSMRRCSMAPCADVPKRWLCHLVAIEPLYPFLLRQRPTYINIVCGRWLLVQLSSLPLSGCSCT